MYKNKNLSMKAVVLLLAVVLMIGCVAGGTLAYLMTKSATVTNTFVAGEIGTLALSETKGKLENDKKQFTVIPGVDIEKDPVVTFNGNNVTAYVFVKVDAQDWSVSTDGKTYSLGSNQKVKWEIADGWTKLNENVFYREVTADTDTENTAETEKYDIIKDNKITVSSEITKADIKNYTKDLSFTAYAIQKDAFENVSEAWTQAQNAGM